ncbi:MAG TPA: hypothetical protein VF017_11770 [Thermoanaerobaculia bacterium]|nr:hypothetical protein [Thermoanaerobaculia bacterium]
MAEITRDQPVTVAPEPIAEMPATSEPVAKAESPLSRFGFRFAFCYFVLYFFPFPLDNIPGLEIVAQPVTAFWHALGVWVGKALFGVEITVFTNGSGDTTYDYLKALCNLVLALAASGVWSVLDRRRPTPPRLREALRVYLRFGLGSILIVYGAMKVIPSQFPPPTLDRLLQPFGDASPMGLLWTFMGASAAYTIFSGAAELTAGLLLALRRTTLLGALLAVGVMTNVVMLNYCYDVPVKLFSSHLLVMALYLMVPDLPRLAAFFVRNRPVVPEVHQPLFRHPRWELAGKVVATLFVLWTAGSMLYSAWQTTGMYGMWAKKSPLYGLWNVVEQETDGQARPPLVTDATRWRRVTFDRPQTVGIQLMNDSRVRYDIALDLDKGTLELKKRDDPNWKTTLTLARPEPDRLDLAGEIDGQKHRLHLERGEIPSFRLRERGFHWINEWPFNK